MRGTMTNDAPDVLTSEVAAREDTTHVGLKKPMAVCAPDHRRASRPLQSPQRHLAPTAQ